MPKNDLRRGLVEPVVITISRREVEAQDLGAVLASLRVFSATREDAWRYRNQMVISVDGYNEDPRELVNIPEVRQFLIDFVDRWPPWAYFINQVDGSIALLVMCCCGVSFPRNGAAQIGPEELQLLLLSAFHGINNLFSRFGFPDAERLAMSNGLVECIEQAA